jgi:GT2 family glycosyltransferase/tetratricopeptide (TPR) repeat protein
MRRCLFGPAPETFSARDLGAPGENLVFDFAGRHSLTLSADTSWDEVLGQLPPGWRPDLLALSLSYTSIPIGLWRAPVPIIGLAADWNLLWSYYRHVLPRCDLVLTDQPGVEFLQRAGIAHVRPAALFGLEQSFLGDIPSTPSERDIDLLFVGNCSSSVQRERLPWLGRLARLSARWNVVIRTAVYGAEYRQLLARAKIVFNRSIRGECNRRVFEAAAAGALLLQERENGDVPHYLTPGVQYAPYGADDLESVIEHYLTHDDERRAIAQAGQAVSDRFTFVACWDKAVTSIESPLEELRERAARRNAKPVVADVTAGVWSAVCGGRGSELVAALKEGASSAKASNAAGLFARTPAEAADYLLDALGHEPRHAVAGLSRTEALIQAGRNKEAVVQAQLTLALLEQHDGVAEEAYDAPRYPADFDLFRVEWERAGWINAGAPAAEREAKRNLLRCWLHSMLADLTADLNHFAAAAQARPDLAALQGALGCALARAHRLADALSPLRSAVCGNPFDRQAARALQLLFKVSGDTIGHAEFVAEQRALHKAAPQLVPAESWFVETSQSGQERSSIIVLACNQVEFTRLCLESVLKHTRGEFELILVDNGSTDETPALFQEISTRAGPARVVVIRNPENKGFAAGVNQGLAQAHREFLVLLNNDTVVTPGWLDGLVAWAVSNPLVGLVGPMTNYTAPPQLVEAGYADLSGLDAFARQRREQFAGQALDVPRLTGFCLLIRRTVLDALGGRLDERYGLGFFEDDDLCHYARAVGFKLLAAQDVYIHHFGSKTFAGLGIDTERQLRENFGRFRDKWGHEAAAFYRFPDDKPALSNVTPRATRPKVSLCMIVRNEENNLADCLGPIRDVVGEVIVVDTGSTDRTVLLARSLGAQVIESQWQDSFSIARNQSIDHARGEWIFWMDADDRTDPDNLARLTKLFDHLDESKRAFIMKCLCVAPVPGETATIVDHVRLFRRDAKHRWTYRVHEQIFPGLRATRTEVVWSDVTILHTGYTDEALRKRKLERDLRLLRLDEKDHPDDPFIFFNLGSVLRELRQSADALPYLKRSLKSSHPEDSIVRKLYSMIAQCERELESVDKALATCAEGRAIYPHDAELLYVESLLFSDKGDKRAAEDRLKKLISGRESEHLSSAAVGLRGHKARHNLAMIYLEDKRYSEAESQWRAALLDEPAFYPAHVGLGEALLQRRAWARLEEQATVLRQLGMRGQEEAEALLGRAMMERQEFQSAQAHFRKVLERFPFSLNLRILHSHSILKEGKDDRAAEQALRNILALAPNDAEAKNNLAVIQRRNGMQVTGRPNRGPRIFVLCPDNNSPSGGVRRLYRHVDVLRKHDHDAFVLHEQPGFRCTWFANDSPVVAQSQAAITPSDYLVVPEIYVAAIPELAPGVPKVIFNQNAYFTFRGWPVDSLNGPSPYRHPDVIAVFAVSDDNREYLQFAFPGLEVRRLHYGIDPIFAPKWPKRQLVAYMPRKNSEDAIQVLNILRSRGALTGWELRSIDCVHERQVAEQLSEAAVFLSFGNPEGCPLPPLEAMASGCVVIGYHGRGGREYFDTSFSRPVEAGDIVEFGRLTEEVLLRALREPDWLADCGRRAAAQVCEHFAPEREELDIVDAWKAITSTISPLSQSNRQSG